MGDFVGLLVGDGVGARVGAGTGAFVGLAVGGGVDCIGAFVGLAVGVEATGDTVGALVGGEESPGYVQKSVRLSDVPVHHGIVVAFSFLV